MDYITDLGKKSKAELVFKVFRHYKTCGSEKSMGVLFLYFLNHVRQCLYFSTLLLNCIAAMICHVKSIRSHFAVESINDVAQTSLTQNLIKNLCFECYVWKERKYALRPCFLKTGIE